jgi:chromosomal replication initiator protein
MSMSVGSSLDQQWARVQVRLKDEVGETAYRSWLKPLTVSELKGSELRISVPTRFMRDWVLTHYADRIRALWSGENPRVQSVEIVVAPSRLDVGASANDDGSPALTHHAGTQHAGPVARPFPSDDIE